MSANRRPLNDMFIGVQGTYCHIMRQPKIVDYVTLLRQLCKILRQLMHPFNFFLGIKKSRIRFYTVGDYGLDKTLSPCFYETLDPDS